MSSSGLKTINFKNMTNDNKEQKLSDSTDTAIAYSTCYPQFFHDDIQIYNGNNIEVLQSLNLDLSKCIFVSDPPFNIGYHYDQYNDKMNEDDYYNWLADIFGTNKQVIIHYPEYLYKHAFNVGLFPEKVVSWVYNSNTGKQHRDIAFFGVKPDFRKVGQPYKNPTDKRIAKRIAEGKTARLYDWWEINQVKNVSAEKTAHPCQMPLKVMENIIGILPDDYTIIDPFLGSGTTALACQKYKRKFIGIELDSKYFEIAKQRIFNSAGLFSNCG
jgi:DNA modification methylase